MKNLFVLLLLTIPALGYGQRDYCKRIRKTEDKGVTTYKSPDLKYATVYKQIEDKVLFTIQLHFKDDNEHFEKHGAKIEFEDGTVLIEENVPVHCKQDVSIVGSTVSSASNHSGGYILHGYFHITKDNMGLFCTKKIKWVQLHSATKPIAPKDATKLMNYIKCMAET